MLYLYIYIYANIYAIFFKLRSALYSGSPEHLWHKMNSFRIDIEWPFDLSVLKYMCILLYDALVPSDTIKSVKLLVTRHKTSGPS